MGFSAAGVPLERNASQLSYKWEPLQKKELLRWGDMYSEFTQFLTCMWGITGHLRKLRNPQRTSPQLYKETFLISIYFFNSAGLKDFLILVGAWNCWHFLHNSWIPVQEGL